MSDSFQSPRLLSFQFLLTVSQTSSSALALLTKLVAAVPSVRAFLRDRLNLVSALSQLLCGLSATNHAKASKVLELLKFVSFGIQITRQEAYLHDLIPKLLGYVSQWPGAPLPSTNYILLDSLIL